MKSRRRQYIPSLERVEGRVLLSTLGTRIGVVSRPHEASSTAVDVPARSFSPRNRSTVISVSARPVPGGGLHPKIIATTGPDGASLPRVVITPYRPRHNVPSRSLTRVSESGPLTTTVTGKHDTTGAYVATTELPGDFNGDGIVDLVDLNLFTPHFGSSIGEHGYRAAADFNHNGRVGQDDARFILRNMGPLSPKIPQTLEFRLAPGEAIRHDGTKTSGGVTMKKYVKVEGRTVPGSLVIQDRGLGAFAFNGRAIAADAEGNFSIILKNENGINSYNFLAIDPFNRQVIRCFPVYWVRRAYQAH